MTSRIARFLPKDPYHLILFALPWLLLGVNVNWPFANGDNWDPWFYWGHSQAFPKLFLSNPCYDGERLPVILPGYLFHHIFAPLAAEVLFHTTFFYIAIYSAYFILKSTQDRHTAVLLATLLACHSFFIGAMGWDYIDGSGIAYYLLTLALLTRALQGSKPQMWLALAGAACGACFYTNPIWVIPMAFFVPYYLLPACANAREARYSAIITAGKWFALGFAGLTLGLGAINYLTVGTFWFYTRSLGVASALNAIPEWNSHDYAWLTRATWLVFPAITFVGVLTFIIRATAVRALAYVCPKWFSHSGAGGILPFLLLGNYFYCFLALFYLTFILRHRVLELGFYANLLIAPMFLALGSGILTPPQTLDGRGFLKVVATAGVICILPLWMQVRYTDVLAMLPFLKQHSPMLKYYLAFPTIVGSAALLFAIALPRTFHVWRWSIVAFSVVGFGLVPEHTGSIWLSSYHGPALYSRVARALDVVRMHSALEKPPFVWFSAQERSAYDYNAICMSLRAHSTMDVNFPSLSPTSVIAPDSLILVLAESKEIPSAAEQALRQVGVHGELESQVRIANKDAAYWITFLRARKAESALTARR
jgi:hypothetical protein